MANFALRQVLNGTLLVEEKVEDVSKNSGGTKTQTHRLRSLRFGSIRIFRRILDPFLRKEGHV